MKKICLLLMLIVVATNSNAQYGFSGNVRNTSGTALSGKTVFVKADSTINPAWMPRFTLSAITDTAGNYSVTLPVSVVNGMRIQSSTVNCNSVVLTNLHTYSGANIINSNFSICITATPVISGQISLAGSSNRASNAKVMLLSKVLDTTIGTRKYYTVLPIDSIIASSNGNFAFSYPTGHAGSLLVHAYLQPQSPNYSKYTPTYHNNVLQWDGADTLPANASSTLNFNLKATVIQGGSSYVTGFVLAGAGIGMPVGTALPNRTLVLLDANNNAIAYTITDNIGTFSFTGLQYGTYKIICERYGIYCTPYTFTLSATNSSIKLVRIDETQYEYNISMPPLSVSNSMKHNIRIYPNPAKDVLYIQELSQHANATISDMTGKVLMRQALHAGNRNIATTQLPAGNYILRLITADGVSAYKFVKE